MLNIALPKGRLGDQVLKLFSGIGYECAEIYENDRRLVLENPESNVRYLLVKPSDVAIYVEYGAADVGVVGKDILLEGTPDVYEKILFFPEPGHRDHQAERLHRIGADPGPVGRDRGYRRIRENPPGKQPEGAPRNRTRQRAAHRQPRQLSF